MYIFFAGCNFRCNYCYNSEILDFKKEFLKDTKEVEEEIIKHKEIINNVVFSGGEPLLQKLPLIELLKFCKKHGLRTAIETNGSKPFSLKEILNNNLLDLVALDIKTPLIPEMLDKINKAESFFLDNKKNIENIKKTLSILKNYDNKVKIEVRTTIIPSLIYRKEDLLKIAEAIKDLKCSWILQQFVKKGKIVNKLQNINPPSTEFLNNLKNILSKTYPSINIKIRTEE